MFPLFPSQYVPLIVFLFLCLLKRNEYLSWYLCHGFLFSQSLIVKYKAWLNKEWSLYTWANQSTFLRTRSLGPFLRKERKQGEQQKSSVINLTRWLPPRRRWGTHLRVVMSLCHHSLLATCINNEQHILRIAQLPALSTYERSWCLMAPIISTSEHWSDQPWGVVGGWSRLGRPKSPEMT